MKRYKGTFTKADGTLRTMVFCKLEELPDHFLAQRIKGDPPSETRQKSKERMLAEGKETVWDMETQNFRVFNWNEVQGVVEQDEVSDYVDAFYEEN